MKLARNGIGPEIFESLQGEGVSMGTPSVFVRLSLCNLHCRWCDTPYTWNWSGTPFSHDADTPGHPAKYNRESEVLTLSADDVAQRVLAFKARNIVLTGGEPLIQGRELAHLATLLNGHDSACRFEIETNGTLPPPPDLDALVAQYNVSPKLANSGNGPGERENPAALSFFAQCERAWFKFVIASPEDLQEILRLAERHGLPPARTLLMPEGTTSEALREKTGWLAPLCLEHGYRLGDRLHVHLYGNKRGV